MTLTAEQTASESTIIEAIKSKVNLTYGGNAIQWSSVNISVTAAGKTGTATIKYQNSTCTVKWETKS